MVNVLFTLRTFKQKEFSGRRGGNFHKEGRVKRSNNHVFEDSLTLHSPLGVGIASLDLKDVVSLPYRSSAIKLTIIIL